MIELQRRDDVNPICPHCGAELTTMWFRELRGVMGKRYVYFCPNCKKVLGASHRKGFFMG